MINDCINIENNIKEINEIENSIKKSNNINSESNIQFYPKEDKINIFLLEIKSFENIDNFKDFIDSNILSSD